VSVYKLFNYQCGYMERRVPNGWFVNLLSIRVQIPNYFRLLCCIWHKLQAKQSSCTCYMYWLSKVLHSLLEFCL